MNEDQPKSPIKQTKSPMLNKIRQSSQVKIYESIL